MSIFSFLKDAGEKFSDFVTGDGKQETAIKNRIEQLKLKISNLEVEVKGDKAILSGQANSNDAREKAILAAGNIQGISEVDARINVVQNVEIAPGIKSDNASQDNQQKDSTFYQVKSGDTLSKIAKQFYGDANRYNDIFKANQPMLSHPDKIYPGQTLRIPQANKQASAA